MDKDILAGKMSTSQVDDVAMVREEQDLGSPRQLGQGAQCCGGAKVVEVEQNVVDYEWHRLMGLKPRFEASQP